MSKHDHILLHMTIGSNRIFLDKNDNIDFDWPPPERIIFDGEKLREAIDGDDPQCIFKRVRMSQLTDEQIAKCPGVARGAEYKYEEECGGHG